MPIDFKAEIDTMRLNFNRGRKEIWKIPKPIWMTPDETLSKIYEELPMLMKAGEVHFAYLVQANSILFKFFPQFNCPANIIFGANSYYDENPFELNEIASQLYGYKGTNEAPEKIKQIVDSITDESERLYNVRLSNKSNENIFFTTIMVYRKHLPGRTLSGSIFPVITKPNDFQSTMILPKQYWTDNFIGCFKDKL